MLESIPQKVSLVGQVVEDLSYEPLDYQRYTAELKELERAPQYKSNGYFVFTDLLAGDYTLRVLGERFQTQEIPVTIPSAPIVFDPNKSKHEQLLKRVVFAQPGDNEVIVVATTVNGGNTRITFEATSIGRPIASGAEVLANGLTTKLATRLDAGQVTSARLESVAGLNAGDIVRIIRDRSIRMRFDPYAVATAQATRIAGKVTAKNEPTMVLPATTINMTKVNGQAVVISDVAGAKIATTTIAAKQIVLGTERDTKTFTNDKGDYTLYFGRDDITAVTLEVTLTGFQTATAEVNVTPRTRVLADFKLERI
jgi:hypothetical protein